MGRALLCCDRRNYPIHC